MNLVLKMSCLDTPLGLMLAIADEQALYVLEFFEPEGLDCEIARFREKIKLPVLQGVTGPIKSIEKELHQYFEGKLKDFKTPLFLVGSPFQKEVWAALKKIPHGKTRSYADTAKAIGRPTAFRAVANANGANPISIVVPCHRVINTNGELGGYGGGISRKQWLLQHENQAFKILEKTK